MAKIASYCLNSNGTVPDFVLDGGHYITESGLSSPQDYKMIGVTNDISTPLPENCFEVFESETELRVYLTSILPETRTQYNPETNETTEVPTDFDGILSHLNELVSSYNQ